MNEDVKVVFLEDGREIHLLDESDISISIISNGETVYHLPIPYPRKGYAGGSLLLSESSAYLLFAYYSGQSEEAFVLFKVRDKLETVFETPYLYGEAASYGFSKDEKLLIQCLPNICEWDWKDYVEQGVFSGNDEEGKLFIELGYVNVLDIPQKTFIKHSIHAYPSENAENFSEEYYLMSPIMVDNSTLKISLPWGDETLTLPLSDTIKLNF